MPRQPTSTIPSLVPFLFLAAILALGSYVRFHGLGARSLWADEFCTWHVSRMDLGESLRWPPELSKPPFYQFCLRGLTSDPRPAEWLLRLPAAVCGVLSIVAAWWIGKLGGGRTTGLALAGLIACNMLQIDYGQEARAYTMLVLGSTLSVSLWYRLVTRPRHFDLWLYVGVTALAFGSHYLMGLTIAAEVCWWLAVWWRRPAAQRSWQPLAALGLAAFLCVPVAVRYAWYRTSLLQGLSWIEPPSWQSTFRVLGELTFGWPWIAALLLPSIVAFVLMRTRRRPGASSGEAGIVPGEGVEDLWILLAVWFGFAWFGLLVSSWMGQPAMISRYALPAAVPALLMPLLIAYRIRPWAPLAIAAVFMVGTAPDWSLRSLRVEPGFRELAVYLRAHTDPDTDAVVLVVDNTTYPNWEEAERLPLAYYPLENRPIYEVHLDGAGRIKEGAILNDPRALQLIVFRADALAIAQSAGRVIEPIEYDGLEYSQFLFTPYRLARVAPLRDAR